MTITYTAEVATCRGFGCFLKLLLRWRGSIYKLVWLDLVAFLFLYYVLSLVYRFALNPEQKLVFESIVQYCYKYSELIPLSFVLGFYVSIVMTRWWNQYTSIPWPDPIAVFVSSNVHGQDERGRVMRRTIMRYVCLCLTMVLINVSPRVKKRFPNLSNLVEAGLLNENEKSIIDSMNKSFPRHSKHWLPIVWAASIITRARKEGRIRDDFAVKTIIDELNKFRGQAGLLISYDTISVPLVYTQVVTLAVYSYFLCAVMGQQWTPGKSVGGYPNNIDLYFPIFTTLQFFFYMGWLKVAESLINPFGDDDDDFEVNWMVDRNLQVSYLIVDEMHHDHPELIKDQYWDEVFPNELPYTVASERFRENHPEPSTAKIEVPKSAAMPSTLSSVRIDDMVGNNTTQKSGAAPGAGTNVAQSGQVDAQGAQLQTVSYEFPKSVQEEEMPDADDASGIHFTAGNGKFRPGSTPSLVSITGTLSRVNTVASALKRFLSREDSRSGPITPNEESGKYRFPGNASSASLTGTVNKPVGSMRITDQVIEEVDEQQTITSHRGNDISRPNVRDIFAPAPSNGGQVAEPQTAATTQNMRSDPVDIPARTPNYEHSHSQYEPSLFPPGGVEALLSSSAPAGGNSHLMPSSAELKTPTGESMKSLYDRNSQKAASGETVEDMDMRSSNDLLTGDATGTGTAAADDEGDDFDKLKATREKERLERQKQKFARSISTAPGIDPTMAGNAATATIVPVAIIPQAMAIATPAPAPAATPTAPAPTAPAVVAATTAAQSAESSQQQTTLPINPSGVEILATNEPQPAPNSAISEQVDLR